MDIYIKDKRNLIPVEQLDFDMLKFLLNPCAACTRNPMRSNEICYIDCRLRLMWSEMLRRIEGEM